VKLHAVYKMEHNNYIIFDMDASLNTRLHYMIYNA